MNRPTTPSEFKTQLPGEFELPGIYASPLPEAVDALGRHENWQELADDLPDLRQAL